MRRLILPLVALTLAATPATAAGRPRCDMNDNQPGLKIEFGVSYGKRSHEAEQDIYELQLRQKGVVPRSVTRTSDGCLEAYVQGPDGKFRNEYYDEDTLDLVWPK